MAVHIIHIPKSGGSAIRFALREAREKAGGELTSEWGPVWGHDHRYRMEHLERGDKAIFSLRDPITRFVSSFYSRLREGEPRYQFKWTAREQEAFKWFDTPGALAEALAQPRGQTHERAVFAMQGIRHVNRSVTHWLGNPAALYRNLGNVLYVARQETLAEDWERLKELLDFPREQMLPDDETIAHRTYYTGDMSISDEGLLALERWYADEYEVLRMADALREGRTPPAPPIQKRLVAMVASVKPRPKFEKDPPKQKALAQSQP